MTYKEYEQKGRDKLLKDFNNSNTPIEYEFTNNRYNTIDCFATATTTNTTYAIEIKNRDISIDKYEEYILELHKYKCLMTAYEEYGYKPIYRCYFKDGVLTWDLSLLKNVEERITEIKAAESTQDYDNKVMKKIILLKKDEAIDKNRGNINNC